MSTKPPPWLGGKNLDFILADLHLPSNNFVIIFDKYIAHLKGVRMIQSGKSIKSLTIQLRGVLGLMVEPKAITVQDLKMRAEFARALALAKAKRTVYVPHHPAPFFLATVKYTNGRKTIYQLDIGGALWQCRRQGRFQAFVGDNRRLLKFLQGICKHQVQHVTTFLTGTSR
ncbi:MAG: hypothetical protein AAB515_01635 [Patescibacteria group bacterium]